MAGSDSQKQLLSLIRDFSTEKSQGERRVLNQRKQIEELAFELDALNKDLEEAKRNKDTTQQELKGYEVELSMNEASTQALGARIALTNNEISKIGSEMAALKSEENSLRDGFIAKMLELNAQIRKIQESVPSRIDANNCSEATPEIGLTAYEQDAQQAKVALEKKIAQIVLHTKQEEEQYKAEQVIHHQVRSSSRYLKQPWWNAFRLLTVMTGPARAHEFGKESTAVGVGDERKHGAAGVEWISLGFCQCFCNILVAASGYFLRNTVKTALGDEMETTSVPEVFPEVIQAP